MKKSFQPLNYMLVNYGLLSHLKYSTRFTLIVLLGLYANNKKAVAMETY